MNLFLRSFVLTIVALSCIPAFAVSEFWRNMINPLPTRYSSDAHKYMRWFGNDETSKLFNEIFELERQKKLIPEIDKYIKKEVPDIPAVKNFNIDPMIKNIDEQVKVKQEKMVEIIDTNVKNSWLVPVANHPNIFKYGTYAVVALSLVAYRQGWYGKIWNKCKQIVGIKKESK